MTEDDVRSRIMEAADALLDEGLEPERITVRRITERAGVGTGSINYHFQSKDELLHEVVNEKIAQVGAEWLTRFAMPEGDARQRLKQMLIEVGGVVIRYPQYTRVFVQHELLHGEMGAAQVIIPVLREIVGPEVDDLRLRLLAFQLVVPLQYAFLREDALKAYLGLGPLSDVELIDLVEIAFDNLLPERSDP